MGLSFFKSEAAKIILSRQLAVGSLQSVAFCDNYVQAIIKALAVTAD
jgi:hypothetical protein